jgi:hypothetical protein
MTTKVEDICEHLAGIDENTGLPSYQEKMDINSASHVVDNLQGLFNNLTMWFFSFHRYS